MVVWRLVISNLLARKVRAGLTVAAVALAVSLVVSVTSGYASVEAAIAKFFQQFTGSVDAEITPQGDSRNVVSEAVIGPLRGDSQVKSVLGRLEAHSTIVNDSGQVSLHHPVQVVGVRRPEDTDVSVMEMEAGAWFETSRGDVVVVDQGAARLLGVKVGDTIQLPSIDRPLKLRIVGIVHKPGILAMHTQTVYVPLETLQDFLGRKGQVSRVMIGLRPGADVDAFVARWQPQLAAIDPMLRLESEHERRKKMDQLFEVVHYLSYLGGAVAMTAATFIIFATLSMGVAERARMLAMLRAVGAVRGQIGATVVLEGLLLSATGAAVGVGLGILWVSLLSWWFRDFFAAGLVVSPGGIMMGTASPTISAAAVPAARHTLLLSCCRTSAWFSPSIPATIPPKIRSTAHTNSGAIRKNPVIRHGSPSRKCP